MFCGVSLNPKNQMYLKALLKVTVISTTYTTYNTTLNT
jgi:hypothetical protein